MKKVIIGAAAAALALGGTAAQAQGWQGRHDGGGQHQGGGDRHDWNRGAGGGQHQNFNRGDAGRGGATWSRPAQASNWSRPAPSAQTWARNGGGNWNRGPQVNRGAEVNRGQWSGGARYAQQGYAQRGYASNAGRSYSRGGSGFSASFDRAWRGNRFVGEHRWRRGEVFADWRRHDRMISDWRRFRLAAPWPGYAYYWDDDGEIVLAALASGLIGEVVDQAYVDDGYGYPDEGYAYGYAAPPPAPYGYGYAPPPPPPYGYDEGYPY